MTHTRIRLMKDAMEFLKEMRLEKYCQDDEYDCVCIEEEEEILYTYTK